jgi:colanic acid/amylovoran biosynthesis glycosyltransferase
MKVLIVGNKFPNTSQVFLHNKTIELAKIGVMVYNLSAVRVNTAELKKTNNQHGVKIRAFNYRSTPNFGKNLFIGLIKDFKSLYQLSTICLKNRTLLVGLANLRNNLSLLMLSRQVDVIHFEWNNQAAGFVEVLPYLNKPYIVSIRGRGITSQPQTDETLRKNLGSLFKRATLIHSISIDLVSHLTKYPYRADRIRIINPAIDLAKVKYRNRRNWPEVRIITVAHYRWKKNLSTAILVISKLIKKGFNITYDLVGEGPDREQLQFMITELQLNDHIFLHGAKPHDWVLERLTKTDIFFMPSIQEGFCNSVIEAQAAGLPCVVTDAEGLTENVENGITGIVVHKFDSDEMLSALKQLVQSEELREKLGAAGRERAIRNFEIKNQISQFDRLYNEAIDLYVKEG